jgi:hypothetical protein
VTVGLLWATLVGAVPAFADPGNGAQIFRDSQCVTFPIGQTMCSDTFVEFNATSTASGISQVEGTATVRSVFGGSVCGYTENTVQHFHGVVGASEENSFHLRIRIDYNDPRCPPRVVCIIDQDAHVVNGTVQFIRGPEMTCTELP